MAHYDMGESNASAFAKLLEGVQVLPRVVIFVGLLVFIYGLTKGLSRNPPLLTGTGLILVGLAAHCCYGLKYDLVFFNDVSAGGGIKWGKLLLTICLFGLGGRGFRTCLPFQLTPHRSKTA